MMHPISDVVPEIELSQDLDLRYFVQLHQPTTAGALSTKDFGAQDSGCCLNFGSNNSPTSNPDLSVDRLPAFPQEEQQDQTLADLGFGRAASDSSVLSCESSSEESNKFHVTSNGGAIPSLHQEIAERDASLASLEQELFLLGGVLPRQLEEEHDAIVPVWTHQSSRNVLKPAIASSELVDHLLVPSLAHQSTTNTTTTAKSNNNGGGSGESDKGEFIEKPFVDRPYKISKKGASRVKKCKFFGSDLLSLTTRELNNYLKDHPMSEEDLEDLKAARRRKKNREYAQRSRLRKLHKKEMQEARARHEAKKRNKRAPNQQQHHHQDQEPNFLDNGGLVPENLSLELNLLQFLKEEPTVSVPPVSSDIEVIHFHC
eukprot:m.52320 g.52320  ORF g.52320 m.52320 type:complete len:372 (-) comp18271_c0_seq1:130-1245(-)